MKNKHTLSGNIAPGATLVVSLPPDVQLGNKGGIITLLDDNEIKVDDISYTKEQVQERWVLIF